MKSGLVVFLAAFLAGVVAVPAGAATVDDQAVGVHDAERVIRCQTVDKQYFCTELGFVDFARDRKALRDHLADMLTAPESSTGDLSFSELVTHLQSMDPADLRRRQHDQVETARGSSGLVSLVDALTDETPLAPDFFDSHPELGIKEGSVEAERLRAETSTPAAGADGGSARLEATSTYVYQPVTPTTKWIMANSFSEQSTSYYCGPATMRSIDHGDDGGWDSQATWARLMGTTDDGTWIGSMTARINASTNWDSANNGGSYNIVSVKGKDLAWFRNLHYIRIGYYGAPVVEHVMLEKAHFSYLRFDHNGHYQTGRGYSKNSDRIYYFEPYDERDWRTGGYATAGKRSVPFSDMFNATKAHAQKNIGA